MRLTNNSPYDTRVLRRCFTVARRWLGVFVPDYKTVLVVERRKVGIRVVELEYSNDGDGLGWVMRLPKLTGNEWHHAARGIEDGDALTCRWVIAGIINSQRNSGSWMTPDNVPEEVLKKLPTFVGLKPEPTPKRKPDRVAERYARVVELERAWVRKQKLATTKVKLYRKRRQRYEKMGLRHAADEA